ncbi:ATP-binding protein [Plantibacter sp. lyk4-40-MEA-4]|uniref:AlbA family DNA-binding domain-containing protein n=1 Tax=Plantibacter sp. lyk4-40-MEA-4 TaxID=3040298 RepID=UPI00254C4393|nr:ATP-binding protein [Plantibacter sp. lyk4-40-MEA-4]
MLSNDELTALIESGYEARAVEFKGPGSTSDSEFLAKVSRAAIALANQRDGGHVIIGFDEIDPQRCGLSDERLAEWLDYDSVVDKINRYADPPLRIERALRKLADGKPVVVLEIAEFDDIPVLCARDYGKTLVRGTLYTRSMRKPESTNTHTQNELRGVLDLATQKQLTRFRTLARDSGFELELGPTDEKQYENELDAFIKDVSLADIFESAHFRYTIRPTEFVSERVDFNALSEGVHRSVVRARGWPYPYVSRPAVGHRWVTEENLFMHRETWAAFESGQFASWHKVPASEPDYRIASTDDDEHYFALWAPITQFTEVIAFAIRYQMGVLDGVPVTVDLHLNGARGWKLVSDNRRRMLPGEYQLGSNEWSRTINLRATGSGSSDARTLAVEPSLHLLHRFGWRGANKHIVEAVQEEAFGGASL